MGLRCKCEGCIARVTKTILNFKGVKRAAVKPDKDMVKVIGSMERKELVSYLEKKFRWNLAFLTIKDYDNVVDDSKKDEDEGPRTDCSPGISSTVQSTCQSSRDDDGIMQSWESSSPGDEQKVTNTVVLKIRQYCEEGCPRETRKAVKKFQGVESVEIDVAESQVKVTGTVEARELLSYLQKKLKREVELIPVERITDKNMTTKCKRLLQSGGMHKEENVCGARDARGHKASKKSKAVSRVHPVNLDKQANMKPHLS